MGPLEGCRFVEIASIGPGPFAAMLLSDLGAEVIRVDRLTPGPLQAAEPRLDFLNRGRRSVAVDLKREQGREVVLRLVDGADGLIEGFRPGVAERLGVGPDACHARNARLVYGRMTGWGQSGPLAHAAGHDLNYIALAGALGLLGRDGEPPPIPLNLLGDFAGGALYLVVGLLAALVEARASGRGQVVDAAIVDGTAHLLTAFYGLRAMGLWGDRRGANLLDGGVPFYGVYTTKDGRHVTLAPLEPQFYAELVRRLGLAPEEAEPQYDPAAFEARRRAIAAAVAARTLDECRALLEGTDACFAPVLGLDEAPAHPHLAARATYVEVDGRLQPAPAPRFSRSAPGAPTPPPLPGEHSRAILEEVGFSPAEIDALHAGGVVRA